MSLTENIGGQSVVSDQFNLEIRMPRFEIVSTADEINRENQDQELLKTTTTHYLTGREMLDCIQVYRLLDWVKFAKSLIRDRTFGVDQS